MFSLAHDILLCRQLYVDTSHFCHAADECPAPWLIVHDCSVLTKYHTCDRVAMLQLEIWSHNWRFFINVFDACFYCLL